MWKREDGGRNTEAEDRVGEMDVLISGFGFLEKAAKSKIKGRPKEFVVNLYFTIWLNTEIYNERIKSW
ncbi:MAG: hypothetical protein U9R19_18860 [Bacteroidota bacterium]|nr:hypothetical protein [Bacteroidota bacterium]